MSKKLEFLHIADIHLGNQQYGLKERFNDFGRAFLTAMDYAVDKKVRFVLISGDLFHKASIDPATLLQAVEGLGRIRQAGIQALAVVGNHDRAIYREHISWLDFLSEQGYLALLTPDFEQDGIKLRAWNGSQGSYLDIEGIRIYGLPYLGASTTPILKELPAAITEQPIDGTVFTILMAHFGLDGEVPGASGGISQEIIAGLQSCVDYLALGHWHKPYERQSWIYNPGSMEAGSMSERNWPGGYYHVSFDPASPKQFAPKLVSYKRRPFYRITFSVDETHSADQLYEKLTSRLEKEKLTLPPNEKPAVIELSLEGVLPFERSTLNMAIIHDLVNEIMSPLLARPKDNTRPTEFAISVDERLSRTELEREVITDLVRRDSRYQREARFWADLMIEVKSISLMKSSPEAIVAVLRERLQQQKTSPMDEAPPGANERGVLP